MYSKKAQGVVGNWIFVILIILAFLAWLITYSQRECHSNGECPADAYCGSDFSCHKYPNVTQTVRRSDFTAAAFLIGLAIVIAAIILRKKQQVPSSNIQPQVIHTKDSPAHVHSHHPEEHSTKPLEKFEKAHKGSQSSEQKQSQSFEQYGEDAHTHTPKHH